MSDNYGAGCGCCGRCCTFIITSGLTVLFIWLSLRTSKPECSIQEFYIPALNTSDNSSSSATRNNHTISFHLQLKNVMKDKGIYYDDLNLTFFYGSDHSHLIGNYSVVGFRQGHHKKAQRKGLVETVGVPWQEAYQAALNKSTGAVFRVDLATKIRYRIMFWHSKRHELVVGANVNVGDSGVKTHKKGIKMKSGVTKLSCYATPVTLLVLFHVLAILLL